MNTIEYIEEKKEKRWMFLNKLYELSGGSTYKPLEEAKIDKELGFDRELSRDIVTYLMDKGLIREICYSPYTIAISHDGIVEVEAASGNPDRSTHTSSQSTS